MPNEAVVQEDIEQEINERVAEQEEEAAEQAAFEAAIANKPQPVEKTGPESQEEEEQEVAQDNEAKQDGQEDGEGVDGESEEIESQQDQPDPEAELLARIEQKLSNRLRNIEGHIGGLNSAISQLKDSAAQRAAEKTVGQAETPSKVDIEEALKSGEKMAALKEDFPEWVESIEEAMGIMEKRLPNIDELREQLRQEAISLNSDAMNQQKQLTQNAINEARQKARLDIAYPNWENDVRTPEYRNWLSLQADETIALQNSPHADDALFVLNLWEEHKKASNQKNLTASSRQNQERLARAVAPTRGGAAPEKEPPRSEHDDFVAAFNSSG